MNFFAKNIIASVSNRCRTASVFGNNKIMGKTTCGFDIEPEGITSMWGTPGFSRAVYAKHNTASKEQTENEAERITAAGGVPKIEVTRIRDESKYSTHGIIVHEYVWSVQDVSTKIQSNSPQGPHI